MHSKQSCDAKSIAIKNCCFLSRPTKPGSSSVSHLPPPHPPPPLSGNSKLSNGKRLPPGACCLSRNLTRKWKSIKTTTRKIRCGKQRKKCCKNYQRKFVESTRATTALIRQSSRNRRKREKRAQANRGEPNLNPLPLPLPASLSYALAKRVNGLWAPLTD